MDSLTATPVPARPYSTYRLQLNAAFPLRAVIDLVPYLGRLGVTHVYLSPILRARGASIHGYDVVDPTSVDPKLGSEADLGELARRLQSLQMGIILDIVPNHMATGPENPFWIDVLEMGQQSAYARWFDIDWRATLGGRPGRVIVPVLGAPLTGEIARQAIKLVWQDGTFQLHYGADHLFPLRPGSIPGILKNGLSRLKEAFPRSHPTVKELKHALADLATACAPAAKTPVEEQKRLLAALNRLISSSPALESWAQQTAGDFAEGGEGAKRLRRLVDAQHYRLVYWRAAGRVLNYRRFFDINDLVSLCQEDPQVFRETHASIRKWVEIGWLDGLRVDHVDGLRDPAGYLANLRALVREAGRPDVPVFVEKILNPYEQLSPAWPVEGTTGYEFINLLESALLDPDGCQFLADHFRKNWSQGRSFHEEARESKRRVLKHDLAAFANRLAGVLADIAPHWDKAGGISQPDLAAAIIEYIAALNIYRTYIRSGEDVLEGWQKMAATRALDRAAGSRRAKPEALALLRNVLLMEETVTLPPDLRQRRLRFLERLQQLSAPATAKGIEDTAFYSHVAMICRNEVGSDPDAPLDDALERLHHQNAERQMEWPRSMLAASTHDTKRSADVRARLMVLSEIAPEWIAQVKQWMLLNRGARQRVQGKWCPGPRMEWFLFQTLVGCWPAITPKIPSRTEREQLFERVAAYALKAGREAKIHTSWVKPNGDYESAVEGFLRQILLPGAAEKSPFLSDLSQFAHRLAYFGYWNSLTANLVRLTAPGTPDLYRGDDLWDFSLVDPDNRRPVDFPLRQKDLDELVTNVESSAEVHRQLLSKLSSNPGDGRIKLHLLWSLLRARARWPELFSEATYERLEAAGEEASHVVAFARILPSGLAGIAVAPRLPHTLLKGKLSPPRGVDVWSNTRMILPPSLRGGSWLPAVGIPSAVIAENSLSVAEALKHSPVEFLIREPR